MIVCIALGLLMIYWLRIKRLKRKNAQEREILETEKKLLELEQKALHLQMNPHFLFNCLNSIKGLVAENKIEESKSYINKFAKLMRSILDSSRESFVTLDKEIELIKNYVYLENLSRDAPIELEVILGNVVDPSTLKIPSMLIQPFVENAVLHGLAQKKDNALIRLSFNRTESFMYCTVEDNGIGRKATIPHREQLHTSAATEVIKERLKILTQRTDAVRFVDLMDGQGQAMGTEVILIMNCILS
jgi:sensor histidine kinase YesM